MLALAGPAWAQGAPGTAAAPAEAATPTASAPEAAAPTTDTVVVVGRGLAQRLFDAPFAVGVVGADTLRRAGPQVNLSEALSRVPGLVVNQRHNAAQDLQISSRGFGARASFGVRGIRLVSDGIPASGPDGQGQVSHFDLAGAERIEVLRGPFSALYGSSSGGVIALVSRSPTARALTLDADAGSGGLRQGRVTVEAPFDDGLSLRASGSRLEQQGFRPQSSTERHLGNARLAWERGEHRLVLVANALNQPAADPLGLTRAQFNADPDQTAPQATLFNTRKHTRQEQAGVGWQMPVGAASVNAGSAANAADGPQSLGLVRLAASAYAGQRSVTQWQSIAAATQANSRHPGGVIDFDRRYQGLDLRSHWRWGPTRAVLGLALDEQREARRGFENFVGSGATQQLGVTGALRRDEINRAQSRDVYAQAEHDLTEHWSASAGLRAGRVQLDSRDQFLANGDDSGALAFSHTLPVLALRWQPQPQWSLYASAGRGHEVPTLGELAYRPDGQGGFHAELRAQTSRQLELGAKWRSDDRRLALETALFEARSRHEIGVQSNAGGRSTFRNLGPTTRRGFEASLQWRSAETRPRWQAALAATLLDARVDTAFLACAGVPCTTPTVPVPAGQRIAGTVPASAFAELAWNPGALELALEARGQGRQPVNDANSDFAAGHGLLAARLAWRLPLGPGQLELQARVDNLLARRVAGSVIVNEGNQRFFEPAPGRNGLLGLRWQQPF